MLRHIQNLYHRLCPRIEVTRRLHGLRCRVNINDHLMWLAYPEGRTIEGGSHELMSRYWGKVWDIGCNFGFYSMVAARAGNAVFAFDMSPPAIELLERSCLLNNVSVTTVARPVTLTPKNYSAPMTSACTNECRAGNGSLQSMTFLEAERRYGTPHFIKMDIEGGEREFLESQSFQEWVQNNGITVLVELHAGYALPLVAFAAMDRRYVDSRHVLISPSSAFQSTVVGRIP